MPNGPSLYANAAQKADLEARNGLLQYDEVIRLATEAIASTTPFKLRPSMCQLLQRKAIHEIYTCAGNYRTGPVFIRGTNHQPPAPEEVPALVEELCDYVNGNLNRSAIHLAAYLMWRVNWIHPFMGGNGRTSRAISYLVMCVRAGEIFNGTNTIPDQIVACRDPYYAALDAADLAWQDKKVVDVSVMEDLLKGMLAKQLLSAIQGATTDA
jgi:fido (protein-threonine AMPylation protein)